MTFFVMWSSMPGIAGLSPHLNYALLLGSSCKKDRAGSAVTFPVRPLLHPCSGQESIFHPVWVSEGMTGRPLRECWAAAWAAVLVVWSWWIIGHGCFILSPWIASDGRLWLHAASCLGRVRRCLHWCRWIFPRPSCRPVCVMCGGPCRCAWDISPLADAVPRGVMGIHGAWRVMRLCAENHKKALG